MASTVFGSAYEKYSGYIQQRKTFTEFLEYIKKHYELREVGFDECPMFAAQCRNLRMNTEHAYGYEGKEFPPSVYTFYEVMNYDFMITSAFQNWDGYRVFIIVDSVMETFHTNSGFLTNELKIIRGIHISDPIDFDDVELRDYLSSFVFLFEEFPKLLKMNTTDRICSIVGISSPDNLP